MNHRYWLTLRLMFIKSPMKRARYMKKHNVFKHIGDRVMIMPRKIPLYSRLISIGSNVWIASGVSLITHDVAHFMLNGLGKKKYTEKIGCIDIGNNVFIGSNCTILYDVKIGDNVIIAANSLINKDVPNNSVVGGVPAKVIGSFNVFCTKRENIYYSKNADNSKQSISKECEAEVWKKFVEDRHKK